MEIQPSRIFPLGDNAATAEFGNEMSEQLNAAAISLADHFERHPFPGFIEAVPAIASTTIFYRPADVPRFHPSESAFERVEKLIELAVVAERGYGSTPKTITVPISFLPEAALDLTDIAAHAHLSAEGVIDRFLSTEYRVYMLGFLPGFAYMGTVDERIATPRRATPRTSVPKGSVGIAGRQTGIYPASSPGGWQIVGRTRMELLTPDLRRPCIFAPGDRVRFERHDT